MSLYADFKTNLKLENEGVKIEYGPNEDGTIPAFWISRMNKSNKAYSKAVEAEMKPYRRQIQLGTMNNDLAEQLLRKVFVKSILKGWENVRSEDGAELEFGHEQALKLFSDLPELYEDLRAKAESLAIFREEELAEDAKN